MCVCLPAFQLVTCSHIRPQSHYSGTGLIMLRCFPPVTFEKNHKLFICEGTNCNVSLVLYSSMTMMRGGLLVMTTPQPQPKQLLALQIPPVVLGSMTTGAEALALRLAGGLAHHSLQGIFRKMNRLILRRPQSEMKRFLSVNVNFSLQSFVLFLRVCVCVSIYIYVCLCMSICLGVTE